MKVTIYHRKYDLEVFATPETFRVETHSELKKLIDSYTLVLAYRERAIEQIKFNEEIITAKNVNDFLENREKILFRIADKIDAAVVALSNVTDDDFGSIAHNICKELEMV